ncbi:MAG: zinc ABC transporter substrate-binding protein [Thermodesulfobacteriota bacterium]
MKFLLRLLVISSLLLLPSTTMQAASRPLFVTIVPLKQLVEQIGGPERSVRVLVAEGQDPHHFQPSPRQITELSEAGLLFTVGINFEEKLKSKIKGLNIPLNFVDMGHGVQKTAMENGLHHHHGKGDESTHDPHIWLSPLNLKIMAKNVARALIKASPSAKSSIERNLLKTLEQLDRLHQKTSRQLAPFQGRTFYVFHPSFGYFARDFHLRQKAVEMEGKSPSARQLAHLINSARKDGARTIFTQPQFDPKSGEAIARAIGGQVVPLNPLAEDVMANIAGIAEKIELSFSTSTRTTEQP